MVNRASVAARAKSGQNAQSAANLHRTHTRGVCYRG
jgi:hypothetical protein